MVAPKDRDLLRITLAYRASVARGVAGRPSEPADRAWLREIHRARLRLRTPVYGYCEHCSLSIPWRDLIAEPERRRCSSCGPDVRTGS